MYLTADQIRRLGYFQTSSEQVLALLEDAPIAVREPTAAVVYVGPERRKQSRGCDLAVPEGTQVSINQRSLNRQ